MRVQHWFSLGAIGLALFWAIPTWAQEDRPENCKLSIHTLYKNGKKRVEIRLTHAYDREHCKETARVRRLDSLQNEDVELVRVFFAYRSPAILD